MNHFEAIFYPETVAVVGASNAMEKWGAGIFNRLLSAPTLKKLYPVNKTATDVQGAKAYPTLGYIPGPVDLLTIVLPSPDVA